MAIALTVLDDLPLDVARKLIEGDHPHQGDCTGKAFTCPAFYRENQLADADRVLAALRRLDRGERLQSSDPG